MSDLIQLAIAASVIWLGSALLVMAYWTGHRNGYRQAREDRFYSGTGENYWTLGDKYPRGEK